MYIFFLRSLLLIFFLASTAVAQERIGTWTAYPSLRTARTPMFDTQGRLWVATSGGIVVQNEDGTTDAYSTIDGMHRPDPTTALYDERNEGIWLGYIDGTLDFYSIQENTFTSFGDIRRNQRFTSKVINEFALAGDTLFIATDFGVITWNTTQHFVLDNYLSFGDLDSGTPVEAVEVSNTHVVAITETHFVVGDRSNQALFVPQNWDVYLASDYGVSGSLRDIVAVENEWWVISGSHLLSVNLSSNQRSLLSLPTGVSTLVAAHPNGLLLTQNQLYEWTGGVFQSLSLPLSTPFTQLSVRGNAIAVGSTSDGTWVQETGQDWEQFAPPGPYLNYFFDLEIDGSRLIAASSPNPGRRFISEQETGFYIFEGDMWTNVNMATNSVMRQETYQNAYLVEVVPNGALFGSWGRGLALWNDETEEVTIFNARTSELRGIDAAPNFIVITGLAKDASENVWATNLFNTPQSLVRWNAETQELSFFPKQPGVSVNDFYAGIFIDSFNQKWISLISSAETGRGLLLLDTGDPEIPDDDTFTLLSDDIERGFLPNLTVSAIAEDRRGEIWVGTRRGLVRYLFPDRMIEGTSNDRRAEYLRTPNNDSLLFRDTNVNSITVNAANQKWIGTEGDGLWLLSENGSRVIYHFTEENSPLISNSVLDVAVDGSSGLVYIATDQGLVSFVDVTQNPVPEMETLRVYPNPYSYSEVRGERVVIEGLSNETVVRVVDVRGFVHAELSVKGGRTSWLPRSMTGTELQSGVYFVIANDENGNQKGVGKLAIIK